MPDNAAPNTGPNPAFSVLVGLTSLVVLLQAVWAGIFLEHDGRRDEATTALNLHAAGGTAAVVLALGAVVIASLRLRGRRDLWFGSIVLLVLLVVEMALGQLIKDSDQDALTAVHVPLAMLVMAVCVWLPVRSRAARGA
jgi:cytochrome bd-type quinol oxidase subunit 2